MNVDGITMKRARKHPPPLPKPRNPVARSPLLGKGGPHAKTASAKRRLADAEARKALIEHSEDD